MPFLCLAIFYLVFNTEKAFKPVLDFFFFSPYTLYNQLIPFDMLCQLSDMCVNINI